MGPCNLRGTATEGQAYGTAADMQNRRRASRQDGRVGLDGTADTPPDDPACGPAGGLLHGRRNRAVGPLGPSSATTRPSSEGLEPLTLLLLLLRLLTVLRA